MRRKSVFLGVMALVLWMAGPLSGSAADSLMLATTTSTDNTGLMDVLAPELKKDTGIELKWTAIGTGKALEMGKNVTWMCCWCMHRRRKRNMWPTASAKTELG